MTTWEQLVRAYVASGRRYWDELDVAQKEALAVAYFRECWRDLGDAAFPSKAAAHDLLGHIADHAYVGRVLVARLVRDVGESRRIHEEFEEQRDIFDAMELRARREPDPDDYDDDTPAFLKPQALA